MARATLSTQTVTYAGKTSASLTFTAPTGAGVNNGWSFSNTGDEILVIKNTDASSKTLTMDTIGSLGGLTPADTIVTVPAASAGAPGYAYVHFPVEAFSGQAAADIDNVTGVTAAVIKHP
jgi:hypothetical protein